MRQRDIEAEANRITLEAAEMANDGPSGKPPKHVIAGGLRIGPKERARLAARIVALVNNARG
jgi:hypothetical protein